MNKSILIGMITMVLISGCSITYDYYPSMFNECIENSPNQNKYCQCWASCQEELVHLDSYSRGYSDCHSRCKDDWNSQNIIIEVNG